MKLVIRSNKKHKIWRISYLWKHSFNKIMFYRLKIKKTLFFKYYGSKSQIKLKSKTIKKINCYTTFTIEIMIQIFVFYYNRKTYVSTLNTHKKKRKITFTLTFNTVIYLSTSTSFSITNPLITKMWLNVSQNTEAFNK